MSWKPGSGDAKVEDRPVRELKMALRPLSAGTTVHTHSVLAPESSTRSRAEGASTGGLGSMLLVHPGSRRAVPHHGSPPCLHLGIWKATVHYFSVPDLLLAVVPTGLSLSLSAVDGSPPPQQHHKQRPTPPHHHHTTTTPFFFQAASAYPRHPNSRP